MMFQGTYTSDFYRTVRNLLHEQVSLQTNDAVPEDVEVGSAKQMNQQRWQELRTHESQYRSSSVRTAAAG
jgi:anaerobic magnesium-protoporphyrin IX monomethyl ester cyclase